VAQYLLYPVRDDGVVRAFEMFEGQEGGEAHARAMAVLAEDADADAVEVWENGKLIFTVR
jgi:hypothetical protein